MKRILVTGAAGQIGSELVPALRVHPGVEQVIASDIKPASDAPASLEPYQLLDCMNRDALEAAVVEHRIDCIYHLAAMLSATAEKNPQRAYTVNMETMVNVLEVARGHGCSVFIPSSIAAFGPSTPRDPTPQDTVQRPTSMYGVTKVAGELLCDYYAAKLGVDVRGVRYPGIISWGSPPGGGTTDYAVEIFYDALEKGSYSCFLAADTQLDMMYMADATRAAIELMEAPAAQLEHRNAFNVTAMQLTPESLTAAIRRYLPAFRISYDVDPMRQAIADSWPRRIDDSAAREEWGWRPAYDLDEMVREMLSQLARKLGKPDPTVAREGASL